MEEKKILLDNVMRKRILLLGILLGVTALLLIGAGVTFASLRATEDKTLRFTALDPGVAAVVSAEKTDGALSVDGDHSYLEAGDWSVVFKDGQESYEFSFAVANGTGDREYTAYDQDVVLNCFATIGLGDPDNVTLTLEHGGNRYEGTASKAEPGSAVYEKNGPGYLFSFPDETGKPVSFTLPGGEVRFLEFTLRLSGGAEEDTLLSVSAAGVPKKD